MAIINSEVISIHAPTRGATDVNFIPFYCFKISIHAPTRGATRSYRFRTGRGHFNPRSHERSDISANKYLPLHLISIHAPTRGATHAFSSYIPAPLFQSTLPREERLCLRPLRIPLSYFNPRSHERSDLYLIRTTASALISIHAPTRGATAFCTIC